MIALIPDSFGARRLREFNPCHDPQTGQFCSIVDAPRGLKAVVDPRRGQIGRKRKGGFIDYFFTPREARRVKYLWDRYNEPAMASYFTGPSKRQEFMRFMKRTFGVV